MSAVEPKLVINVASLTGTDDQKVQTALNQARTHVQSTNGLAIVYFPTGTYTLTTTIPTVSSDRNIVFQGAGSDKTFLVFQNMKNLPCFNLSGSAPLFTSQSDLNQNFNKGDSIIHAANGQGLSGINSGDWIHLIKYGFDYQDPNAQIEKEIVGQITRLEAKGTDANGEWGEIKDVANMNYVDSSDPNYSLKVREITPIQNIGIEDLTINRNPSEQATAYVYNINFEFAVNCWVKGVESYKASRNHFKIGLSSHIEVSGCYFHEAMGYGDDGWGYGVETYASTTNCLIENNIFRKLRHAMVAGGGSNCNVWTFNYSREKENSQRDLDLHAKYPFGHLFEHNVIQVMASDDYHGDNGPYNAVVRNYAYDGDANFKTMEYWSTLGNIRTVDRLRALRHFYDEPAIMDRFGYYYGYTIYRTHSVAIQMQDEETAELLDISYYYSQRPDFLTTYYTWPAVGPKISSTVISQNIPAKDRFNWSKKTYLADPTPKPLTTSGTMAFDQTWPNGHTLTGNVTVPDNITLTIADGATVNLNGYYVQCTGSGQIIKAGSATFSPSDISINSGAVIKGQYPSVASAIANVVSGQTIIVASGTHTIGSNLTVASGVTLQVNAGATLNFTGSYILQISGVLTITGTSGQHVIIDGQGHARASMENAMIVVQGSGTANIQYADFRNAAYELTFWQNSGAVTVQNCTFTSFGYTTDARAVSAYYSTGTVTISTSSFTGSGLNGMGVYAMNTGTNVTVTGNTFTSRRVGIRCYASNADLMSNTIANSGYYGIQSDNVTTAAEYRSNTITNSSYGIYLNSSSPWIMQNVVTETRVMVNSGTPNFADFEEGEQLRGYNTIANAVSPLLQAQNYATPYLGYGSEGGYNSLYDTDFPHMHVENHSGAYADNNYWGGGGAANQVDGTSWALARNPLASNPNPLAKASFAACDPCADQSAITLEDEEKLFQQALDAGYRGEYEQARSILQTLIENNSGSKFTPLAILMYYEFNRMELRDGNSGRTNETIEGELVDFLTNLENRDKADSLRPFGLKLSAREAGFSRDFKRMSDYHTLIMQDYPNSVHELTSLYDKIAYYVEIERDLENAKVLLARMIDAYPKDKLTAFARILAGEDVELDELEKRNEAGPAEDQLPTQISLGPAFPNPFNPSTTISYQIPEAGRVRLRLYDMLGQLVTTLVDREVAAGKHSVVWDGRNERGKFVATGVYLYRMEVASVVRTKKLVLAR